MQAESTTPPKKTNGIKIKITSYNPEAGQTDNTPCVGASGKDVCKLAKDGVRVIALSQDLVGRSDKKKFKYGDKVRITTIDGTAGHSDPRCNGEFIVEDTMNKRFTNRADLFFLSRKDNISCTGHIEKVF